MKVLYTIGLEGINSKLPYVENEENLYKTVVYSYIANALSEACGITVLATKNKFWDAFTEKKKPWFVNSKDIGKANDEKDVVVDFLYLKKIIIPLLNKPEDLSNEIIRKFKESGNPYEFNILKRIILNSAVTDKHIILNLKHEKSSSESYLQNIKMGKEFINFSTEDFKNIQEFYNDYLAEYYKENILPETKSQTLEEVKNNFNLISHFNFLDCDTKITLKAQDLISFIPGEYKEFKGLREFLFDKFYKKTNKVILEGQTGSGKSQIAYSLYLEAHSQGYHLEYIAINDLSEKVVNHLKKLRKKMFVVIEGIEFLDINGQKLYLKELLDLTDKNDQTKILITSPKNHFNIINLNFLINLDKIEILPLKISANPLIKTFTDYLLMKDMPQEALRGDHYFKYIWTYLKKDNSENYFNDMARLAFSSFKDQIRINDLKRYKFSDDFKNFIAGKNNFISSDINRQGLIYFSSELIRDYLASEHILSFLVEEDFKKQIRNTDFKNYKYQSTMLFIAEKTDGNVIENSEKIVIAILYHLRTLKMFSQIKKIISLINGLDSLNGSMYIEISKYYYSGADYRNSVGYAIKAIQAKLEDSGTYNHLASCFLDLYLPSVSLKLSQKALEINQDLDQEPRILGNIGRANLRMDNYTESEKNFQAKLQLHKGKSNDILRDKNDLILVKAYIFQKTKNYDLYFQAKELFNEVIGGYQEIELSNNLSQATNAVYAYRNLSYFLPYLNDQELNNSIDLINYIQRKSDNSYINDINALSQLNLVKVYIKQNKIPEAKELLNEIISILKSSYYRVETYIAYLLYNFIEKNQYIAEAEELYGQIKSLAKDCLEDIIMAKIGDFENLEFTLPAPDEIKDMDDVFLF